jgi:pilus assembly protein FimV
VRSIYSLALAFSLVLLSASSWALGLGEITVTSKLGENFNASIPITNTAELDVEQIKASNATADIYTQLKVDNSFIYQSFKLNISSVDGKPVLNITTSDSIREPYLNFVIQMKWPAGQINKEFKVLIDP